MFSIKRWPFKNFYIFFKLAPGFSSASKLLEVQKQSNFKLLQKIHYH